MNAWKPLAILSTAAFVTLLGYATQVGDASAATASASSSATTRAGSQPNMEAARDHLRQARAYLEKAEHNKGGWRVAAVQSTDVAIREVSRGITYANE